MLTKLRVLDVSSPSCICTGRNGV